VFLPARFARRYEELLVIIITGIALGTEDTIAISMRLLTYYFFGEGFGNLVTGGIEEVDEVDDKTLTVSLHALARAIDMGWDEPAAVAAWFVMRSVAKDLSTRRYSHKDRVFVPMAAVLSNALRKPNTATMFDTSCAALDASLDRAIRVANNTNGPASAVARCMSNVRQSLQWHLERENKLKADATSAAGTTAGGTAPSYQSPR
jgi:hypothetical protein